MEKPIFNTVEGLMHYKRLTKKTILLLRRTQIALAQGVSSGFTAPGQQYEEESRESVFLSLAKEIDDILSDLSCSSLCEVSKSEDL